jgi:hypothetical protein
MLAKFAEDDRIEQMNAQKRRMRQLEHKRAVEQLIEERREQFRRERVRIQNNRNSENEHFNISKALGKLGNIVSCQCFAMFPRVGKH